MERPKSFRLDCDSFEGDVYFADDIDEYLAEKDKELAEAKGEVERLSNLLWGSRCVYCGEVVGKDKQNQDIADEILRNHVETCPKHPLSQAKGEIERLRGILARAAQTIRLIHPFIDESEPCIAYESVTEIEEALKEKETP